MAARVAYVAKTHYRKKQIQIDSVTTVRGDVVSYQTRHELHTTHISPSCDCV